jgi:hypothetical protein
MSDPHDEEVGGDGIDEELAEDEECRKIHAGHLNF